MLKVISMLVAAFVTASLLPASPGSPSLLAARALSIPQGDQDALYRYRMKGKVRLLLFWVGKDDVGGGHIAVTNKVDQDGNISRSIEVLFGSNPDRVPGGVNRWGYGKENSLWVTAEGEDPVLKETLFQGFMKHSGEGSVSEVMDNEKNASDGAGYWYEGTSSLVREKVAVVEKRRFSTEQDFDYRNPDAIFCGYQNRVGSGAPDQTQRLSNQEKIYTRPYGFLTAVQRVLNELVEQYSRTGQIKNTPEPLTYVYNAKAYELSTDGKKLLDQFEVPGSDGSEQVFKSVAKVEFELRNLASNNRHDFTIWFPLEGELQGIPVRILDRPRWWLGVELNLEGVVRPAEETQPNCP